jgi:organic radical activating enzyme
MRNLDEFKVKLIEVFNTWQGEGPDKGRSVLLLRFKYCNKQCPWCDTLVKMRITPEAEYKLSDLQQIVDETYCGLLITGGEPTFNNHFDDTLTLLNRMNYPFANVESNGLALKRLMAETSKDVLEKVKFIYSPKIFNQADLEEAMMKTDELVWSPQVYIKVVYDGNEFVEKYLNFIHKTSFSSDVFQRVYLMPEGKTREELLENAATVFDLCERYRVNFSSRDHIIYGFI